LALRIGRGIFDLRRELRVNAGGESGYRFRRRHAHFDRRHPRRDDLARLVFVDGLGGNGKQHQKKHSVSGFNLETRLLNSRCAIQGDKTSPSAYQSTLTFAVGIAGAALAAARSRSHWSYVVDASK